MTYRRQGPCYHSLFRGVDLDMTDVRCAGHDGGEETVAALKLVFVRRGTFLKQSPGREELADPATLIVFAPGEPYRIRHPLRGGDRCTSIGVGERLLDGAKKLQEKHQAIGDVRGVGLFIGMELVRDRESKEPAKNLALDLVQRAFRKGLLLLPAGRSVIRIAPPLVVDEYDVDKGLEILDECLEELT